MKITLPLLAFLLLAAMSTSAQSRIYAEQNYKGKIDNQYEIELTTNFFESDDSDENAANILRFTGNYQYTSTKTPIDLSGFIYWMDRGFVMEYNKMTDGKPVLSEKFSGTLDTEKGSIDGTWTKVSKNKTLPFTLQKVQSKHRSLFLDFIGFYINAENDAMFPITGDFSSGFEVGIPYIQGLSFPGGISDIIVFRENQFAFGSFAEKFQGEAYYDVYLKVLPNDKCTVLEVVNSGNSSWEENEDGTMNMDEAAACIARVWQWNGKEWLDISAKVFPPSAQRSFSLEEGAEGAELRATLLENDSFSIGSSEDKKTWKWDGKAFIAVP